MTDTSQRVPQESCLHLSCLKSETPACTRKPFPCPNHEGPEETGQLPGIPYSPGDPTIALIWANPRMIEAIAQVPEGWRVVMTGDYDGKPANVIVPVHHQVRQARNTKLLSKPVYRAILRAAEHTRKMWARRYDTDTEKIPDPDQGEPFGCPVAVDLGDLAVVQSELDMALKLLKKMEKTP